MSATALSQRTYLSFISAMSYLVGLSPECVQLVMIMVQIACGCAAHTGFALAPGSPTDVSPSGGGLSRAHSVGSPPCRAYATAACDHSGDGILGGCHII